MQASFAERRLVVAPRVLGVGASFLGDWLVLINEVLLLLLGC